MKKTILFLVFCLTAGIFTASYCSSDILFAQETNKEKESFYVAKRAFQDGFYDVAVSLFKRFLVNYPGSVDAPEAHLLIGRSYFNQNKFLEALNKFEYLIAQPSKKDIKDAAYYWIAEVHFRGNNFSKAKAFYKVIIDEFPDSSYLAAAYYSLGWCQFQEQQFKEALDNFIKLEEKFPQEPQVQDSVMKIIECLYNLQDYESLKDKTRSYLSKYSKDKEKIPILTFYMAEAEYYLDNFSDAIEGYLNVIKYKPQQRIEALSRLGIAWAYLKLKHFEQAETAFEEIDLSSLDKKNCDILLLGRAILAFEKNNFEQSGRLYRELIESAPQTSVFIQACLGEADSLYNMGEYRAAVDSYKQGIAGSDSVYIAGEIIDKLHYGLAWAYLKEGEFKEAIKEFQRIVRSSEDKVVKASALCQIGDAYQDAGDYSRAQETYDTILKDYPDSYYSDYVQYQLGITLLKNSNYDGAIMSFLTLKRNYPNSKLLDDAYYALGLAYFQRQDYPASKEVFETFTRDFIDSPFRPLATYLLGTSLYNMGEFAEAVEIFKNIIRNYGDDIDLIQKAEYEIADCYYRMGNEDEAMARFNSLRAKYPNSQLTAEIIWWLGEYHYIHDNVNKAKRYFLSLISDFPDSNLVVDAYYALGSIFAGESKHEQALNYFKKVIELDKSDLAAQATIAIADVYIEQEKSEAAFAIYRQVVDRYPHLANVIYPKMADYFYKIGNYDDALFYYRKSGEVVPLKDMAQIQFKIAETLQSRGELQEAVEEYFKVTYLYSEDEEYSVRAFLRAAKIYEDKENFNEALNIYRKMESMDIPESKYARERIEWIKDNVK